MTIPLNEFVEVGIALVLVGVIAQALLKRMGLSFVGVAFVLYPLRFFWGALKMVFSGIRWAIKAATGRAQSGATLMGFLARYRLMRASHTGLLLDGGRSRLSLENSCRNLCVVASTGAGKTSTFILPNLLTLDNCSIVCTDPSGALFEKASGDLAARGFEVLRFDPLDLAHSVRYNPLAFATRHSSAGEIAHVLMRAGARSGGGGDPFWESGAEEIMTVLIRCLLAHPEPKYRNLANLHHLLGSFGDGRPLFDFVSQHADEATFRVFQGFIAQAPNTMQGLLSSAKVALKALADPDIARMTATNTLDFAQFRQRKTALFLTLPQNRLSYYSFLASLLYHQFFDMCLDDAAFDPSTSLPVFALLDEFGHLSLPSFAETITTTRARRVSISIVLQAMSQLEERYGRAGANTIIQGGIASKIYMGGMDVQTAEMLSRTVGTTRQEIRDSAAQLHLHHEPLLSASALRTLPDNQALYLFANKAPTILQMLPYFASRRLRKRTELPRVSILAQAVECVEFVPV
jgi:type IV secretion system protein VirD4